MLFLFPGIMSAWLAWQFRPPPSSPAVPQAYEAQRAVWLGVDWAMVEHSDAEVRALACELWQHNIADVFAYVSYLKPGDFFNLTFDYAKMFTEGLRLYMPDTHILAWIGLPVQATSANGERRENRLADPTIRALIADFSAEMVTDYGFDGVHLNAELVADGDAEFLATLQAVRDALPAGALLSTTAHALRLTEQVTVLPYPTLAHHWSASYLRQVSEHVDQIALMAYDSGLPLPSDYRAWVTYQVKTSAASLAGTDVTFLVGVPASEEWTPSHQTASEYLANALTGVRFGIVESAHVEAVDGIAVYPHWETDSTEWATLDSFFPAGQRVAENTNLCE